MTETREQRRKRLRYEALKRYREKKRAEREMWQNFRQWVTR